MSKVSIRNAIRFSFSFLFRNFAAIAVRIALPSLFGWLAFYVSLVLYLTELIRYLGNPSDRIAGLVLGLATAGLLVTLFLHSVIVASVTALALGLEDGGWKYFHVARREWRLYAANLRLLLVTVIWSAVVQAVQFAAVRFSWPGFVDQILDLLMLGGMVLLTVRVWFLLAPVSVANNHGEILRRAWRLSSENLWHLAAIVFVLLLAGLVVEVAGEMVLRISGALPPFPITGSLANYAVVYRAILPYVLVVIGIAYIVGNVLLTAARVYVYRQLTEKTEP